MKYLGIPFALIVVCSFSSCDKEEVLTEEEIVQGLKAALEVGTDVAVTQLHATDGYFLDEVVKILLPSEAGVIIDNLSLVPGGQALIDSTIQSINRAAEDAAIEAKPIFVNAINNLTIEDGVNILHGTDSAATHYLRANTNEQLYTAFKPKIQTSLSKPLIFGSSAETLYSDLIGAYNTASLGGVLFEEIKVNTLSEFATRRALSGLFLKVRDEEKLIREDPLHRVSDILKKVFGELDKES